MPSFKRRGRVMVDVPVAAMSDVAFLLIIFFILASSFRRPGALNVELPGETAEAPADKAPLPKLRVGADALWLNGQRVAAWQVGTDLRVLLAGVEAGRRLVVLTADDAVPMERVVEAMDAVRQADAEVGFLELDGKP